MPDLRLVVLASLPRTATTSTRKVFGDLGYHVQENPFSEQAKNAVRFPYKIEEWFRAQLEGHERVILSEPIYAMDPLVVQAVLNDLEDEGWDASLIQTQRDFSSWLASTQAILLKRRNGRQPRHPNDASLRIEQQLFNSYESAAEPPDLLAVHSTIEVRWASAARHHGRAFHRINPFEAYPGDVAALNRLLRVTGHEGRIRPDHRYPHVNAR